MFFYISLLHISSFWEKTSTAIGLGRATLDLDLDLLPCGFHFWTQANLYKDRRGSESGLCVRVFSLIPYYQGWVYKTKTYYLAHNTQVQNAPCIALGRILKFSLKLERIPIKYTHLKYERII